MQRSLAAFNQGVAAKWGIRTNVLRTIRVIQNGLEIEVDDDVITELKEGQDMSLEIEEVTAPVKREWDMTLDDDGDEDIAATPTLGVVLRLRF